MGKKDREAAKKRTGTGKAQPVKATPELEEEDSVRAVLPPEEPPTLLEVADAQQFRAFQQQIAGVDEQIVALTVNLTAFVEQRRKMMEQRKEWWTMMCQRYKLNTYDIFTIDENNVLVKMVQTPSGVFPEKDLARPLNRKDVEDHLRQEAEKSSKKEVKDSQD